MQEQVLCDGFDGCKQPAEEQVGWLALCGACAERLRREQEQRKEKERQG